MSNLPSSTNPIAVADEGNDSPPSASSASDGTGNEQVAGGVAGAAGKVAGVATNEESSSSSSSPGNNCETTRALQFATAQPTTGNIDGTPIASNVTEDVTEHHILGKVPVSRALEYNNAGMFEQLVLEQKMKDEKYKQMKDEKYKEIHGSMGKKETSSASSSESSTTSPSQSTPQRRGKREREIPKPPPSY